MSTKKTCVVDHWVPIAPPSNPTGGGWLPYPENKPRERLLCCMVCNVRGYMHGDKKLETMCLHGDKKIDEMRAEVVDFHKKLIEAQGRK